MILEAFAKYLQRSDENMSATHILGRWLWERLSSTPQNMVDQVLHSEIKLLKSKNSRNNPLALPLNIEGSRQIYYIFKGKSISGIELLNSLYEFSLSYEQQKWARWVHSLKASDFSSKSL